MAKYIVSLATDDAFAADSRTFWGVEGKITTTPSEVELTAEQAQSLKGHGVIVEYHGRPADKTPAKKAEE